MKTLKRLDLKKCTELKSAEMKEILGGGIFDGPTCDPGAGFHCGGSCTTSAGTFGTCRNVEAVHNLCGCVEN